ICEEIFGPQNELGTIVWDKRNPKGRVAGVAYQHEYILVYSKNINVFNEVDFSLQKENALDMLDKVEELTRKYGSINDEVKDEYKNWLSENRNKFSGGEYAYNKIDKAGNIY